MKVDAKLLAQNVIKDRTREVFDMRCLPVTVVSLLDDGRPIDVEHVRSPDRRQTIDERVRGRGRDLNDRRLARVSS